GDRVPLSEQTPVAVDFFTWNIRCDEKRLIEPKLWIADSNWISAAWSHRPLFPPQRDAWPRCRGLRIWVPHYAGFARGAFDVTFPRAIPHETEYPMRIRVLSERTGGWQARHSSRGDLPFAF